MFKIIVLTGPTGAGKSSLMFELVRHLPDRLAIIKSLTSRPRRDSSDDLFYQFVTKEEIEKRQAEGRIFQCTEYAGYLYANDKQDVDRLLEGKYGLIALIEDSVPIFKNAGYQMVIIRLKPKDNPKITDETRITADSQEPTVKVKADLELVNSFKPGGKEKTVRRLFEFIHRALV